MKPRRSSFAQKRFRKKQIPRWGRACLEHLRDGVGGRPHAARHTHVEALLQVRRLHFVRLGEGAEHFFFVERFFVGTLDV